MKINPAIMFPFIYLLLSSCTFPHTVTSQNTTPTAEPIKATSTKSVQPIPSSIAESIPSPIIFLPLVINPENSNQNEKPEVIQIDIQSFDRRDVPPSDVIEQISYIGPLGGGGPGFCSLGPPLESTSPISSIIKFNASEVDQLSFNETGAACISGFKENEALEITIIKPDKKEIRIENSYWVGDLIQVDIFPKPGDPLGMYKILAKGVSGETESSYEVIRPSHPIVGIEAQTGNLIYHPTGLDKNKIYVNSKGKINSYLAGFPPSNPIKLDIFKFIETIFIPLDTSGETIDPNYPPLGYDRHFFEYSTSLEFQSNYRGELVFELINQSGVEDQFLILISHPDAPDCSSSDSESVIKDDFGNMKCDFYFVIQFGEIE